MSDRDAYNAPPTRTLETEDGSTKSQLEQDVVLLKLELKKVTSERDELKQDLEKSLTRISELEDQQRMFLERLDKIEALILHELNSNISK